ncbi:MAG TPA: TonB-dependent receptor [Gemmatimonadaceae bacterium]|nr:TonB-dependent receptor [Gemmatimonadaceae bacterium]
MQRFRRSRPTASVAALLAALLATAMLPRAALAQALGTIRGTVVDSTSRQPVPGAQITVVGTTRGAVTSDAGAYTLRVPAGTVTLRVMRLGYAPAERQVTVGDGATVTADIAMQPVPTVLSAVVSVGYGNAQRANVTSAIASVRGEEIANAPVAGLDAAIQGKIPGVQVVQNAGNPGNGITVRVRGPASLNAGNQPLYVVDGVPVLQEDYAQLGMGGQDVTAISSLNPDEIASIDVLKDAAAAAIYGSRGSNGVVLITTKRGQAGGSRITLNAYTGTQRAERRLDLLNAQQYVEIFNESAANDGYDPEDYPFVVGEDDARSYDWQDAVFRSAPISDVQLGVSGGTDRTRYYLSGSYFDQRGVVVGSAYNRAAGRVNVDFSATDRLSFRTSVALTREDNDRIEGDGSLDGVVTNAIGMQPMRPIVLDDGAYAGDDEGLRYSNPVALADLNSTTLETMRALGNVEAQYRFGPWLSLTGRVGMDVLSVDEAQWESPRVDNTYAQSADGVGKTGHTSADRYVLESFLTADPSIGDAATLSLTGGASVEYNRSELNFVRGEGFTSGFEKYVRNAAIVTEYDGSATEHNLVSVFGRATYSWRDRYLLSASLRTDGSSRFGADNRYGLFPALSAGWLLSDESWAGGLRDLGATLKLRASYGITGNEGIGDFAALGLASGVSYVGTPGITPTSLANPDLRWETTHEFDGGLDLTLLDGRVGVIADYYRRNTSDLLVQRPIPALSGFTSIWDNVGEIRNTGVDLSLQTRNVRPAAAGDFSWSTDLNVTLNRNEVTALYGGQPVISGINGRETSIVAVGEELGAFYMYRFDGVDPETGDAIIADVDGDGEITSDDRTIVGSPHPDYFGGLTNTFGLRGFELRTFLQFSVGNDVFNMMRIFTDDGACTWDNKTANVLARWRQPGDVTDVPRMSYDCASGADLITSRFIEDGSYLRLGEVTLSYTLPSRWAARLGLDGARLYVSGRNLHTWTDYSGYNPDVNSAGSGSNFVLGTDYYAYPLARTFSIGTSAAW